VGKRSRQSTLAATQSWLFDARMLLCGAASEPQSVVVPSQLSPWGAFDGVGAGCASWDSGEQHRSGSRGSDLFLAFMALCRAAEVPEARVRGAISQTALSGLGQKVLLHLGADSGRIYLERRMFGVVFMYGTGVPT
jgi:hypothetical protein